MCEHIFPLTRVTTTITMFATDVSVFRCTISVGGQSRSLVGSCAGGLHDTLRPDA